MATEEVVRQTLYRYNPWWEKGYSCDSLVSRDQKVGILKKDLGLNKIIVLTGLRRIGKTSLIKLLIADLIDNGVEPSRVFYVSADEYVLRDQSLHEILDIYRRVFKISFEEKVYVFFDEITYRKDYELELKNIFDTQNVKLLISSSSSSLLKSGKPFLTGRTIVHELDPLSFKEYLNFKEIEISGKDRHLSKEYFEEYLKTGGIPEYVLTSSAAVVKELVDDIIKKDIAMKNNLTDETVLEDFFMLLVQRSGGIISKNKIAKILGISSDTASRYIKMFQDVFLINLVSKYGKPNQKVLSPKKLYLPDTGLKSLYSDKPSLGSLFENYVYLRLKKHNPYYVMRDGLELDFYIYPDFLIEVKYCNDIEGKQKDFFDSFEATKKFVVKEYCDVDRLESLL